MTVAREQATGSSATCVPSHRNVCAAERGIDRDGIEPVANAPEEFAAQIKTDLGNWARIVKAAGAKLD